MDINVSEECADSIFRLKPEVEGRRLLHNICTHLTSYKVSHSFRPLSCRDSLVKTSHITEWFLYSTVTRNTIHQQNGTVHITTAEAAPLPGAFNKLTVTDQKKKSSPGIKVLMATGVVLFHRPSHTSLNCSCPNLRTNFRELRSISHWSRVL